MKKKRLRTPWIHCVGGGLFKIVSSGFSPSSSSVKLIFNCPENDRANRLPRVSVTVHFRHLSNKCDELSATGVGEYDFFFKKLLTCLQNISIKVELINDFFFGIFFCHFSYNFKDCFIQTFLGIREERNKYYRFYFIKLDSALIPYTKL